jgi:hypothetical protein
MTLRTPRLRREDAASSAEARSVTGISGEGGCFGFVGGEVVAEGIDGVGEGGGGGRVEDGGDSMGVGEAEAVFDGGER